MDKIPKIIFAIAMVAWTIALLLIVFTDYELSRFNQGLASFGMIYLFAIAITKQ